MLKLIYKSKASTQLIIIIISLGLLWIPRFFYPQVIANIPENPFYNALFGWTHRFPFVGILLAFVFILAGAIIERMSLDYDRLRVSGHFFPLLVYSIFASGACTGIFSPVILTMLFLALTLQMIFIVSEIPEGDSLIFFVAFLFGLATIFYSTALSLLVYWLFVVIIFEGSKLRRCLLALSGFLLPWIWLSAGLYLSGNLILLEKYWDSVLLIPQLPDISSGILDLSLVSMVILISIIFIINRMMRHSEGLFIIRQRVRLSIVMIIFIVGGAFFSYNFYEHLALLAVPMTSVISYSYHEGVKSPIPGVALLVLFLFTLLYPYLNLWL